MTEALSLLTLKQAASLLGVNEATLRGLIHNGDGPPAFRVGPRLLKFDRHEVEAWLRSRRLTPNAAAIHEAARVSA